MKDLKDLIRGCMIRDRASQKMLYQMWYTFAMGICLRYAQSSEEAVNNMNEGFFFVYDQISAYDHSDCFELWLKEILIGIFIAQSRNGIMMTAAFDNDLISPVSSIPSSNNLQYNQLIMIMQQLPQELRTFFNMYAIDGYTYKELSSIFMISEAHSKLIIAKARQKLWQITIKADSLTGRMLLL
jgi:RNA polymerase sigma factor (sigma-70 family)